MVECVLVWNDDPTRDGNGKLEIFSVIKPAVKSVKRKYTRLQQTVYQYGTSLTAGCFQQMVCTCLE